MRVETRLRSNLHAAADDARDAEALGYDGLVSTEIKHDPFFPLVLAAEHTSTITLTTGVAIAFPRSPMITATIAWDLQRHSNGRFRLGIGPQVKGHNERRFSVPWSPPAPRLREYVLALRAIWDCWAGGGPLDFEGDHYRFNLMPPVFRPEPIDHPRIPVYISAVGPVMCRVAGEFCDGLRTHSLCSAKYLSDVILPNVEEGARAADRSLDDINITAGGFTILGDSDDEIRRGKQDVARRFAFYASTCNYQAVLDVHGWGGLTKQLHDLSVQDRWDDMPALITDDMLETFALIGSADDIAPQLLDRYATTCSTVVLELPHTTSADNARARRLIDQLHAA